MSRSVVLYTRAGCHLCEDAEALLRAELRRRPFALQTLDVDGDPELARRYGVRVPVVVIDGEEAFELQLDARRLRRRLRTPLLRRLRAAAAGSGVIEKQVRRP